MKYPKKLLTQIGINYIGTNVLKGVYWFNIKSDEKDVLKEINNLNQLIIRSGEKQSDIYTLLKTQKDQTVIINPEIYNTLAIEMFNQVFKQNPDIPAFKSPINIQKLKENEINFFVSYIKSIPVNTKEIDVYLYKTCGERLSTLFLKDKQRHYKKKIYGFYLVEQDIETANKILSKFNRRISNITQKEMLGVNEGIRYTIELDDAIIL